MKDDSVIKFTAKLKGNNRELAVSIDQGIDSPVRDICYFVDNVCARLQELKSSAILKVICGDNQPDINLVIPKPDEQWDYFLISDEVSLTKNVETEGIVALAKIKLKSNRDTILYLAFHALPFSDFTVTDFLTVLKTYDEKIKEHFKNKEYFMEVGYGYE